MSRASVKSDSLLNLRFQAAGGPSIHVISMPKQCARMSFPQREGFVITVNAQERHTADETFLSEEDLSGADDRPGMVRIRRISGKEANSAQCQGNAVAYLISMQSLRQYARIAGLTEAPGLRCDELCHDAILYHLSGALLSALEEETIPCQRFVDWFLLSFFAQIVEGYAVLDRPENRQSGGLSPGNRRRVDEILENRISNGIALPDLARACGLSAGHFSRAFRATFGMTAHRRMMQLRIRRAQLLLRDSRQPIAAIAREVGFMDQAAFTKRFVEMTGSTPGRYRRFAQAETVLSNFIQV